MHILIVPDSFKESLSAQSVAGAIKAGFSKALPEATFDLLPIGDGGEGTMAALIAALQLDTYTHIVTGPFGEPVSMKYARKGDIALFEMADLVGLASISPEKRNPLTLDTRGLGELILYLAKEGVRQIYNGVGGSATNDGGIGMLKALGYQFSDENGQDVGEGGQALERVSSIIIEKANPILKECNFHIACDVTNPLCGKNGATYIYGPQKGVTPEIAEELDQAMNHYASVTSKFLHNDYASAEGAGAAGGLGFAFLSYLNATLTPGIDLILNAVELEKELEDTDITVTGEGRLDHQTAMGKAPVGVARLAKKYGSKVVAFAGSVTPEATACNAAGIDAFFPIVRGITTLAEAMDPKNAKSNMAAAVEQVFRLL